jgi:flagellar assembly protein FliH
MSSSSSPAPEVRQEPEIRPFLYVEVAAQVGGPGKATAAAGKPSEAVPKPNEILAQLESVARETGRREGEAAARVTAEQHLAQVRASVDAALAGFAGDRARYYQQVETEVVQLALAIARKILHREAQIDPMLLAGMVRITLEKIESATKVIVRVHPQQVSECRSYFAQHMEASQVPDVVEDAAVQKDQCVLQTALGTTEVGADLQLKEIEQGLFDLLAKRPASV